MSIKMKESLKTTSAVLRGLDIKFGGSILRKRFPPFPFHLLVHLLFFFRDAPTPEKQVHRCLGLSDVLFVRFIPGLRCHCLRVVGRLALPWSQCLLLDNLPRLDLNTFDTPLLLSASFQHLYFVLPCIIVLLWW